MRKTKKGGLPLGDAANRILKTKIRGFTLMEMLVYLGVFSVASVFLTNILLTVTDITGRESASREVSSQLDATLETIQALIQQSSNIESASGSTLKLRMSDPASDPTCITLESGVIKIAQGPGTPADECSNTKTSLTTDKVVTNSLTFTKIDNIQYSEAEGRDLVGHSVVNIDMAMTYSSTNPKYAISRTLTSAIGRVSAATFDSDLLPDTTNTRSIGTSALRWQNLNVNGTAYFAGNVGVGVSTPTQKFEVNGNIKQGRMILWTGTVGNFAQAANQVGYINFGDIAWNGQIEVELIGGYNHTMASGALVRRFSFHHAAGGTSLSGGYSTEVVAASGTIANNYAIGDAEIYETSKVRIPIYQVNPAASNTLYAKVRIFSSNPDNLANVITVTAPTTVENTMTKNNVSFMGTGNFGIGILAPKEKNEASFVGTKMHVLAATIAGEVEVARFEGGNDTDNSAAIVRINHSNDRGIYIKGGRRTGDNSFGDIGVIQTDGSLSAAAISIDDASKVGIGTTAPGYKLDVVSGGATTARFGTAAGDTVVVGGGSGKLTVGTVDPLFNINGEQYSTYTPGMTGVKEETTGVLKLTDIGNGEFSGEINFAFADKGSDFWLFRSTTNFGEQWKNLSILLTPGFKGEVYYEKDVANNRILIAGSSDKTSGDFEVSYRLTAPRFDYLEWPNVPKDAEPGTGLKVK